MTRPRPVDVLTENLDALIASSQWANAARQPVEQRWLLLLAVCEALHPLGPCSLPSPEQMARTLAIAARDVRIREGFRGNNYPALAQRFGLTTRQVRRIVHGDRSRQHSRPNPRPAKK